MTYLLLFVALALGISFLCSILEAVLLSVTPSFVAAEEKAGRRVGARMRALKLDIDRPLAAILTLNTIAHTAGAAGAGAQALKVFGSASVALVSVILTFLILVFSEIVPKTLGAKHWKRLAPAVASVLPPLIVLMYPLVLLSDALAALLARKRAEPTVSREEFSALSDIMAREGMLDESESQVLGSLLRVRSLAARDIMTPRTVVVAFDERTPIAEVARDEANLRFSRFPVYRGDMDHMTGFVLKHDLLLRLARGDGATTLRELRRELVTTTDTTRVPLLFEQMVRNREHIALVVDSFGGTAGIVTLEDVVETLLGLEIVDEVDITTDMQAFARQQWLARAKRQGLPVGELEAETPPAPREPRAALGSRGGQLPSKG
jgi:CBS domain containing-hemolysin-like protein